MLLLQSAETVLSELEGTLRISSPATYNRFLHAVYTIDRAPILPQDLPSRIPFGDTRVPRAIYFAYGRRYGSVST